MIMSIKVVFIDLKFLKANILAVRYKKNGIT
jgi:hypothetical protein